ncbi:hypothetical protein VZQ01_18410 [Myxococcus faecalis]|uniref:hypothetical protein n=1 Tax=Myxococcus faecalis TaxID=3115646 RepID=UPI003CEAB8FF
MTPLSKPLLLLSACATAFLAGRQTALDTNEQVLHELANQRAVFDTLLARASSPSPDVNERVLRELASQRAVLDTLLARTAPSPDSRQALTPEASVPASAENLAAAQEGERLVDAALRVRRWTSDDAQAFRAALADMTPDQRTEALRRLLTAINSQALQVQTGGAPF